ncbi:hypothetical protein BV22DRAFT_1134269 [Leucogyrophana mollusca]|uniref:Uncharacterized protein n=1 Tax=Leucogyrophana mollusca TaxID=85980 RepID=A0ACB8B0W6_9AGAM|nr:hypothetical protein BV22DRAFT_1134269 [Leucogyrophana mollusca]
MSGQEGSDDERWDDPNFWKDPSNVFSTLPKHLRPEAIWSQEYAQVKITRDLQELFHVYDTLHGIVLAHEDTLRKRWTKRTRAKKRELLRTAWPGIPGGHAPDVTVIKEASGKSDYKSRLASQRTDFLLNFVNLEDLTDCNGSKFLSLLHFRAHLFPSEFAQHDHDNITFGVVATAIKRVYVDGCSLLCYGDRSTYGKMIMWAKTYDDGLDGLQLQAMGEALNVSDAILVYELQIKLLSVLLRASELLLRDVDLTDLAPQPPLPPPEILTLEGAETGWESIARQNNLRSYIHPEGFSFESLYAIADAEFNLARDHLIQIRTDPSYLAEYLEEHFNHRLEHSSVQTRPPVALLRNRAARQMLFDVYMDFGEWYIVLGCLKKARSTMERFKGSVSRGRAIPAEYQEELLNVRAFLFGIEKRFKQRFPVVLASSPPLRSHFEVQFLDNEWRKNKYTTRPSKDNDDLFNIVIILLQEDEVHRWKRTRLYDQLDTIMSKSPEQRERISHLLSRFLEHWGNVSDALGILERHRPKLDPELFEDMDVRYKKLRRELVGGFHNQDGTLQVGASAYPVDKYFYPKGPKTVTWAQDCDKVDEEFAAFWRNADRVMKPIIGHKLEKLVQEALRPYQGPKEPWANLVVRKKEKALIIPSPGALFTDIGHTPAPAPKPESAKAKVKRRGAPVLSHSTSGAEDEPSSVAEEAQEPVVAKLTVPNRVLKTWSSIFRMASDAELNQQRGSIPWSEILYAFAQLGWSAIKLRGSAWLFTNSERSFTCHSPHPGPSLDFWKARALGRRLTRRFGWTGESFAVKEQTEAER